MPRELILKLAIFAYRFMSRSFAACVRTGQRKLPHEAFTLADDAAPYVLDQGHRPLVQSTVSRVQRQRYSCTVTTMLPQNICGAAQACAQKCLLSCRRAAGQSPQRPWPLPEASSLQIQTHTQQHPAAETLTKLVSWYVMLHCPVLSEFVTLQKTLRMPCSHIINSAKSMVWACTALSRL